MTLKTITTFKNNLCKRDVNHKDDYDINCFELGRYVLLFSILTLQKVLKLEKVKIIDLGTKNDPPIIDVPGT